MPGAAEIRARIAGVSETKKVTDAMYMIASAKLRRARRGVEETKPYFRALKEQIADLFHYMPDTDNRYFRTPAPEGAHRTRGVLLITSDRGLAGSYNQAVLALAEEYLSRHAQTVLFIVGAVGRRFFDGKGLPYEKDFIYPAGLPGVWEARRICTELLSRYDRGELDEIHVIYTDYHAGRPSECKRNCLLPLERSRFYTPDRAGPREKEFYPGPDAVLSGIVPSYLTGFIYGCLVDSYCSEQEARMTAMHTAGENAQRMLTELQMQYHRLRQAAITREITEVTAGARALSALRRAREEEGTHAKQNG